MSDSLYFTLTAIKPQDIEAYLAFKNQNAGRDPYALKGIIGSSRNGTAFESFKQLLGIAGLADALGFLAAQQPDLVRVTGDEAVGFRVTGEFRRIESDEDYQRWQQAPRWGNHWETYVFEGARLAATLEKLESLWRFCIENLGKVEPLQSIWNHDSPQALLDGLAFATDPNNFTHDDDGESTEFLMATLFAVRELFRQAKAEGLALVHVNDLYRGIVEVR